MPENKIPSLLIQVDTRMEQYIAETVLDYLKSAEDYRLKKDWGKDFKGSTLTFEEKIKNLKDLYYGNRPTKTLPWASCSNRSMKIAMAIIEMLHSRMFPAVWNEDLIRWKPTERTDKEKAERITKLMGWWVKVRTKMHDFFDKWCKVNLGFGQVFTEVSYEIKSIDTGETEEIPITDDFGIQLYEKDGTLSVDKRKKLKTDERTKTEMIPIQDVYFQEGQTSVDEEPVIIKCKWLFSELEDMEKSEKAVNVTKSEDPNTILQDKIMKNINETMANVSSANLETLKEVKLRSTPVDIVKCYLNMDVDRDGFAEDIRVIVDATNRIYLGGIEVKHLSRKCKRPINFTKINDLIDNPDGLEGLGFLEMVMPLAEEIDAIFNQLTDANTLSVMRPFFYDPAGSVTPQNIVLGPNKGIPVPDPQRNIYIPDFRISIDQLILALRTVLEFVERLTSASSYVMGKESEIVGGSGTATRTQAIVMAAEQRFALPAARLRRGAAHILTLILDQLQKNLPPGMESRILGEDGEPIFGDNELTTESISGELDAYILEDPAMGSLQAEKQLAAMLYSLLMQNPIVMTDPVKIYKETANLLKAYGQDPEEHLGKMPEEKDIDSPEDENTLLVQGDFQKVRALLTENHIQHIKAHKELLVSPTLAMMQPAEAEFVVNATNAHIEEHMMMLQQMLSLTQKTGGKQNAGGTNQGANAGNQGINEQFGMEALSGPLGAMEATKKQGQSNPNPSM